MTFPPLPHLFAMMDNEDEPRGPIAALRARSGVILGAIGLIAWLALIWLMFGDVL